MKYILFLFLLLFPISAKANNLLPHVERQKLITARAIKAAEARRQRIEVRRTFIQFQPYHYQYRYYYQRPRYYFYPHYYYHRPYVVRQSAVWILVH